jgi:hypothetical protein
MASWLVYSAANGSLACASTDITAGGQQFETGFSTSELRSVEAWLDVTGVMRRRLDIDSEHPRISLRERFRITVWQ